MEINTKHKTFLITTLMFLLFVLRAFAVGDSINVVQVVDNGTLSPTTTTTTATTTTLILDNTNLGSIAILFDQSTKTLDSFFPFAYFSIQDGKIIQVDENSNNFELKPEVANEIKKVIEENTNSEKDKEVDICMNLEGVQVGLPADWMLKDGKCYPIIEETDLLKNGNTNLFNQQQGLDKIVHSKESDILNYTNSDFLLFLLLILLLILLVLILIKNI